jgi:hypothetical protein
MILEAVAAVTTACKALEMASGACKNIEDLGGYISKLGSSEFDLQRAKNSKNLTEAESMKIVMAEEAEARKNRQAFLKAEEARKKKFRTQLKQVALIALVCVFLVPAAVGALLAWLTNR